MTWGVTVDVPASVDLYDALHATLLRRTGSAVEGLLVHVARATDDGFQVIEVWESRHDYDRYVEELVAPALAELTGGRAPGGGGQTETTFDVRGLVLPTGGIAR